MPIDFLQTGLPADLGAEGVALGMVLWEPDTFPKLAAILSASDFSSTRHQKIHGAMKSIYDSGGIPDVVAVAGFLADHRDLEAVGGQSYLTGLYDPMAGAVVGFEQLCRRVRDKAVLREFITRFHVLSEECLMHGDSQSVIQRAEAAIQDMRKGDQGTRRLLTVQEIVTQGGGIDAIFSRSQAVTSTPFAGLNYILGGGFREDELIILAARPGFGKSALAAQIADFNASHNGVRVVFFGLEMSNNETLLRMACSRARVNSNDVRMNRHSKQQRSAINTAISNLNEIPIHFDDTASATVGAVHAALRTLTGMVPILGLVVIDYLQLMDAPGRYGNRAEQVSSITRGLKLMAKEFHVPVMALSALTRESTKLGERPQLHHLRESGSIEQDANTVIFLHPTIDDMKEPIRPTDLIIAKQRNGPIADVSLEFHKEYTRFEEPHHEDNYGRATKH